MKFLIEISDKDLKTLKREMIDRECIDEDKASNEEVIAACFYLDDGGSGYELDLSKKVKVIEEK